MSDRTCRQAGVEYFRIFTVIKMKVKMKISHKQKLSMNEGFLKQFIKSVVVYCNNLLINGL